MTDKVTRQHLDRRAAVYVRQSTLRQVRENRESTSRQYGLKERAVALGWPVERIDVIDEDLGHSATTTQGRGGFQRLAEDVAHGRLGAIFTLEASRLARCSADWHRLLDLCALADVLIVDERKVFSPKDSDDRFVLGLQGTMSEAEQLWRRLRLQGAKLNKAKRGELFIRPPIGYEWDKRARSYRLHPDQRVQQMVNCVFDRFRLDGSANGVVRYLIGQGLRMPRRDHMTGEMTWVLPNFQQVIGILHNPVYAGAYVFGRTQQRTALVDGQVRLRTVKHLAEEEWEVCLKDHHPAYIDWDSYVANQQKLTSNQPRFLNSDIRGAPREGHALLQGLVLCGKCGNRMYTLYRGNHRRAQYRCRDNWRREGECVSWGVASRAVDEAVVKLFLETIQPPELDLSLAVVNEVERQSTQVERQWALRRDQAHYEARLAEKRYKSVDPENRAVAGTLEAEWNEKLKQLELVEQEYADLRRREKLAVSDDDRRAILALTRDLPRVWSANSTTYSDRKTLLRTVIQEIGLRPIEVPSRSVRVQILWKTGVVTELVVARPDGANAQKTSPEVLSILKRLLDEGRSGMEIAQELNSRGHKTARGLPWDRPRVNAVISQHKMRCGSRSRQASRQAHRKNR